MVDGSDGLQIIFLCGMTGCCGFMAQRMGGVFWLRLLSFYTAIKSTNHFSFEAKVNL
jgi:hypothetical protein